jgi:hypothetical protein
LNIYLLKKPGASVQFEEVSKRKMKREREYFRGIKRRKRSIDELMIYTGYSSGYSKDKAYGDI